MKYFIVAILFIFSGCNNRDKTSPLDFPVGGYDFPDKVDNENIFCYPLLKSISRRDSSEVAYQESYFFKLFGERNLSLKAAEEPVFRLTYQSRFSYVITITPKQMIVKSGIIRYWPEIDYNKLTEIEKIEMRILKHNYPLDEIKEPSERAPTSPPMPLAEEIENARRKRIYDSIMHNTPKLYDGNYYNYLLKKANVSLEQFPDIKVKSVAITPTEFEYITKSINESGYWKMPYEHHNCSTAMDGWTLIVEANTGKKYNYTKLYGPCDNATSKFHEICEQIFRLAKIENAFIHMNP